MICFQTIVQLRILLCRTCRLSQMNLALGNKQVNLPGSHCFCLFVCLLLFWFVLLFFRNRVYLCSSPGCPGTLFVDQDGLELTICLPLPPEC